MNAGHSGHWGHDFGWFDEEQSMTAATAITDTEVVRLMREDYGIATGAVRLGWRRPRICYLAALGAA